MNERRTRVSRLGRANYATKIAVARILGDGKRQRTQVFSELQSHYLFEDRFGRPGNGKGKGKVEGLAGYARRNFLVRICRTNIVHMRLWSICIAACLVLGMAASPVQAQTQAQADWCNKGKPGVAIGGCTAIIQSGGLSGKNLAMAFINRGKAFYDTKDFNRAIADFSEAIRLDPKGGNGFFNRGNANFATKNYDRAIADYSEAIKLHPKDAGAFYHRGLSYEVKQNYERAFADYSEAIRIEPNAPRFNSRCWVRTLLGRELTQALADCNESLRLSPGQGYVLNSRGLVHLKLGAFDRAIADYSAALGKDPKDADSRYGRGIAKLKSGNKAGGEADMAAAKAIRADIGEVYSGYGVK